MTDNKYKCFKFDEQSLFDQNIGPAYKDNIVDDMKISNGSNSINSISIKIKIIKINGVIKMENEKKEKIENFWYNPETGITYDFDLQYPIGKIIYDDNELPLKYNKNTYYINTIPIPLIREK